MIDPADSELLQRYLDGSLPFAESQALQGRLKSDPLLAEAYIVLAREESLLTEWARSMAAVDAVYGCAYETSVSGDCGRPSPSRLMRMRAIAAAACLLLGLGTCLTLLSPRPLLAPPVAWLEEANGEVFVAGRSIRSGSPLRAGEELRTGTEPGHRVIRYADGTRLVLGSDTVLRLLDENASGEGKRLYLVEGYVHANVAKQPTDRPLILATPHAQVRVLGTRFSSSTLTRGTRIELEEGRIQVSSAGQSMDLRDGRYVVDVNLPQRPLQTPPEEIIPQILPPQKLPQAVTRPRITLPRSDGPVLATGFSSNRDTLAVGSWKGVVDLWDLTAGNLRHTWESQQKRVRSLGWSPDGDAIVTAGEDRTVKVWDARNGKLRFTLPSFGKAGEAPRFRREIEAVAFSPDSQLLAIASGILRPKPPIVADVTLWDARTGEMKGRLAGHTDVITSLVFLPDSKTLATGSRDGTIRFWDRETLTETDLVRNGESVLALACSPDGRTLATGSRERFIRLFDIPSRRLRLALEAHPKEVKTLAFAPDGRYLASGGSDASIRLWEVRTGRPVALYQGHNFSVSRVEFSPDGHTLATAGSDRFVKLWDVPD